VLMLKHDFTGRMPLLSVMSRQVGYIVKF